MATVKMKALQESAADATVFRASVVLVGRTEPRTVQKFQMKKAFISSACVVTLLAGCGGSSSDVQATSEESPVAEILRVGKWVTVKDPAKDLPPNLNTIPAGCAYNPGGPSDLRKLMMRDDGKEITYILEYGKFCLPPVDFSVGNVLAFDTDLDRNTGCQDWSDMGEDLSVSLSIGRNLTTTAILRFHTPDCRPSPFPEPVPLPVSLFIGGEGKRTYLTGTIPRSRFPGASVKVNTLKDQLAMSFLYTFQNADKR